jgi:hypothetical protein
MTLRPRQTAVAAFAMSVLVLGVAAGAQSVLTPDQMKYRPGRPNLDDAPVELLPVQGSVSHLHRKERQHRRAD